MKRVFNDKSLKRIPWVAVAIVVIALIGVIIASVAQVKSHQSDNSVLPEISFEGRYRIDGGEWKPLDDTKHISAGGGAVELEGSFVLCDWETGEKFDAGCGTVISFYLDHVKATIKDSNGNTWESDNENELYGKGKCSATWEEYPVETEFAKDLHITIYNPHGYGNAGAVDSFLKSVSIFDGYNNNGLFSEFEPLALVITVLLAVFLLVLFGAAIFASLLHQKNSREIWLLWLLVFFGGAYFIFSRENIGILNPLYAANNMILGSSMMIYFLTAYAIITSFLNGVIRRIATAATVALGAVSVASMLLSVISPIKFYDTYICWASCCAAVGLVLFAFIIVSIINRKKNGVPADIAAYVYIPSLAVIVAFYIDAVVAIFGIWQNGLLSMIVLFAISVASAIIIGRVVPQSIKTILNAKSIEAEKQAMELKLQESHISIMLSQIQPHFLYNALNSIYHLCETNPMLAKSMVNSFSEYLRNNLSSLEETGLVPFETELSHIRTYLDIEKVRFEDTLEIEFDIQCVDFALPVLTVQPIVENAVKHGTSKKRGGGKVSLSTLEDKDNYIIKVSDTGCGFDPLIPKNDGKRHIGIENVRQRLSNMCRGSLTIESEVGVGTVATIRIPKGDKK